MPDHLVDPPEWTIDARGGGSFRVECTCGWDKAGFDTASLARAAGEDHITREAIAGRSGRRPASPAPTEPAPAPARRGWFRRGR